MNGLNQFTCVGHLGGDPELRYTPAGTPVLNFSVAINESWKDSQGKKQERVEWVRCTTWGAGGEALSTFLRKGMLVAVVGRLRTTSYEKNGEKRYSTQVMTDTVNVLTPKGDGASEGDTRERRAPGQPRPSARSGPQRALDELERTGQAVTGPMSGKNHDSFANDFSDDEIPF